MRKISFRLSRRDLRKAFPEYAAQIERLEKTIREIRKLCRAVAAKERLKKLKARDRKLSRAFAARYHKKPGA